MKVTQAINYCLEYHRTNSKKNSIRPYESVLSRFESQFGDRKLNAITSDEILSFLNQVTEGAKQSTKRSRYSSLASFFNFIKNTVDPKLPNPCSTPMLRKLFKPAKTPIGLFPGPDLDMKHGSYCREICTRAAWKRRLGMLTVKN